MRSQGDVYPLGSLLTEEFVFVQDATKPGLAGRTLVDLTNNGAQQRETSKVRVTLRSRGSGS